MRNQVTLSLKGADKVFKNLEQYPKKVQKAVDNTIMSNMTALNKEHLRLVPRDTGRLAGSLHLPERDQQGNWYLSAYAKDEKTGTEYAPFLEFGTVKMAAQPFFYPPFFERYNKIIKDAKNAIEQIK